MNVHVIRAPSRHQLLINARRRVGPEALILSVRQGESKDGKGTEWEAVVAKDEPKSGSRSSSGQVDGNRRSRNSIIPRGN